ncbi:ribosomal protein S18-alanine N-acetyltransferase [Alkaliphilus peptidifermentans]|uniref:[Ribosomal protein bS18]-alanine N-acetyltransferase n=1 Tax=Alkaliphilus peptidifermentans DSM 18978 TaxID=1120976 RepID=A0A1G5IDU4_9FIRM|nr:ribosomal protein S18-alanine N-acetyltransferase [Alkaliphilus peptidifermentans]SCY74173.1 [SSU ribosomal protein S18P]-alanine acetyltransferase [Alkaliphilus peptidifermentans DSM 18978]
MEVPIIRKMTTKDLNDVMYIEENSFPIPWTKASFEKEIKSNICARYYVAVLADKIVAYLGMWIIIDEAHITNIAVHPQFRGKKIGKKIVEEVIKEAIGLGIARMTLEVRKNNITAQGLYRSLGFLPCGIRPGYYSDNGEDAVIMWKELKTNM